MTPRAQLALRFAQITQRLRALPDVSDGEPLESPSGNGSAGIVCDRDTEFAERERLWLSKRAIQRALERIDAGTFGVCEGCGIAIEPKRLAYVPESPLCRGCAAEREDRARMALRRGWEGE